MAQDLEISSSSFKTDGEIPKRCTGFGEDLSPAFSITGIDIQTKSIAIVMDDLDIPFIGRLNHWLIWNLPVVSEINEGIKPGAKCENGAVQGVGYGKNKYRGPKQPPFIKKTHRYSFKIYGLDCMLELSASANKDKLLKAMDGHIIQDGELIGWYKP